MIILMLSTALSSPKVFADDTTLPVLDPAMRRSLYPSSSTIWKHGKYGLTVGLIRT
jgi:hypothetical protein